MINFAVFAPLLNSVCTIILPDINIQHLIEGKKNVDKSVKYSAAQQLKYRSTLFITEELVITPILSLDHDLKPTIVSHHLVYNTISLKPTIGAIHNQNRRKL